MHRERIWTTEVEGLVDVGLVQFENRKSILTIIVHDEDKMAILQS